jgi:hypothetical protein
MHESIHINLSLLASFALLGFFFGGFYEVIRIIRLFKKQSDLVVCIIDFMFLTLAGVITFAYSMELGNGQFRWFFIMGQLFGAAVYFLTIGRLVSLASNFIVRCVKWVYALIKKCLKKVFKIFIDYICKPAKKKIGAFIQLLILKFGNSYGFIKKRALNSIKHLKSNAKIVYNKKAQRKNTVKHIITGDKRNVIKGKIRKHST